MFHPLSRLRRRKPTRRQKKLSRMAIPSGHSFLLAVGAVAADQIDMAPASAAIAQKHDLIGKARVWAARPAEIYVLSRRKSGLYFLAQGAGKKKGRSVSPGLINAPNRRSRQLTSALTLAMP
jgi:hypothetical protein